ncbi:MAG: DUF3479 domain-containing protein, partial [Tabrizicola sp.]|nr:DUF3479 domain-containing protein [Tabrizicola sp.]
MRDDRYTSHELQTAPADLYRFVIVTLDAHAAGPAQRVAGRLAKDFPGLTISVHAAAEWAENPAALARARRDVAQADIIVANLIFLEEHLTQILPDMQARRDQLDACVGIISDPQIVKLTKMGDLDMSLPASGAMAFLKKLRGAKSPSGSSGEKQMAMLRRLPKILRFIPGKAQDMRAWFLSMQYWLGGSDDNIESMVRFLVSRYAPNRDWNKVKAALPVDYPDVGLYHPDVPARVFTDASLLPRPDGTTATVGLLMLR